MVVDAIQKTSESAHRYTYSAVVYADCFTQKETAG